MRTINLIAALQGLLAGASLFCFIHSDPGTVSGMMSDFDYNVLKKIYYQSSSQPQSDDILNDLSDYVGFLSVHGTNIDYPVMRDRPDSNGNYYYLDHNYKGDYDVCGCPFVRDTQTINDDILTVFAHNSSNGKMFAQLELFEDVDFFDENNMIMLDTDYGIRNYEVVAVLDVPLSDDGFSFWGVNNLTDMEERSCFECEIRDLAVNYKDYDASSVSQYLLLVTCEYSHSDGRRIVVAAGV